MVPFKDVGEQRNPTPSLYSQVSGQTMRVVCPENVLPGVYYLFLLTPFPLVLLPISSGALLKASMPPSGQLLNVAIAADQAPTRNRA